MKTSNQEPQDNESFDEDSIDRSLEAADGGTLTIRPLTFYRDAHEADIIRDLRSNDAEINELFASRGASSVSDASTVREASQLARPGSSGMSTRKKIAAGLGISLTGLTAYGTYKATKGAEQEGEST